ncbi:MAG TPA: FixH family protein [Geobacteraceae bacterium]
MQNAAASHSTGYRWLLAGLIAVFLAATVTSIIYAARKVSRVTDPDYYSHGLNYEHSRTDPAANNWQVQTTLGAKGLLVVVVDHAGKQAPVESAHFIPDTGSGRELPAHVKLTRNGDGMFLLALSERNTEIRGMIVATGRAGQVSRKVVILP